MLYVHFKQVDPSKETWASYIGKKCQLFISDCTCSDDTYYHAEVSLAKGTDEPITYYADKTGVFTTVREFTSLSYETPLPFPIDENAYYRTKEYLEEALNKPFNWIGYYMNFIPILKYFDMFSVDTNGASYFCVELVAHALLVAGIVDDINPHKITAQELYRKLRKGRRVLDMNFTILKEYNKMQRYSE